MKSHERFQSKVNIENFNQSDSCHLWTAALDKKTGLPKFYHNGRMKSAKRFAYETFHNIAIPQYSEIYSICNVASCVNPKHLAIRGPQEIKEFSKYKIGQVTNPESEMTLKKRFLRDSVDEEFSDGFNLPFDLG